MNKEKLKMFGYKVGFIQPQCKSWNNKQKTRKIMKLISKEVKTHIFEDNNVGIIWGNYQYNKFRELMITELALWLNSVTT